MSEQTNTPGISLGSLFDGIGGFPYAASFFGIKPLWASEIMAQAVSVTRRHIPEMAHMGDITALDGAKLPPVDIITFGSPCQDLSVAGKRAGLGGKRSGLFTEAVRIIDEMREETDGRYPRYAVWENVPGALSSGKPRGSDFRAVLEALAKTEIPAPASGRWANAGMVRGGGADLAWCVYDAQYFGVPQRRRRIFLVCDFGGGCAGEVLFVPKSLSGYFAARREKRETPAADAARSADGAGSSERIKYTAATQMAFSCNQRDEVRDLHDLSAALCAQPGIKQQTFIAKSRLPPWGSHKPRIFAERGILQPQAGTVGERTPGLAGTASRHAEPIPINDKATRCKGGGPTRNGDGAGNGLGVGKSGDPAPTITSGDRHAVAAYCLQGNMIGRQDHNGPRGSGVCEGISFTLTSTDVAAVAAVDCRNLRESGEISGTLQAKAQGYSLNYQNPVRFGYIVRRLLPIECERLQGYPDGWTEAGHDGKGACDTRRYQMLGNSVAVPCVAYIMLGIVEHAKARDTGARLVAGTARGAAR